MNPKSRLAQECFQPQRSEDPGESLADSSRPEPSCIDRDCHIVTFYEDFDGATRVREAFDTMAETLSPDRPINASAWSFTMLTRPQFNADVFLDIARADVLVIAAKGDGPQPSCIRDWVEKSITETVVLVALPDPALDLEGELQPFLSALAAMARAAGATFLPFDALRQRLEHAQAEPIKEDNQYPSRPTFATEAQ